MFIGCYFLSKRSLLLGNVLLRDPQTFAGIFQFVQNITLIAVKNIQQCDQFHNTGF